VSDPRSFYTERIPAQFNRALEEQAARGDAAAKLLEDMRAVCATLCVVVEGDAVDTFFLNVEQGRMTAGDQAQHPPFLTLVQDRAAFEVLERESGDSALGFLGGMAGMAGEMKLTQTRIDNLADLKGAIRFELTGEGGFSMLTHFGSDPIPEQPNCSIRVDADAYRRLRSGELAAQEAFMGGQIQIDGDMQMAMQLALAALSPD